MSQRSLPLAVGQDVEIFIDGASRGNPGKSGIGVLINVDGKPAHEIRAYIGIRTNNQAEYEALIAALNKAVALNIGTIRIFSDSLLVANQINGLWKIKDPALKQLFREAKTLLKRFDEVTVTHVRRELNREADRLANEAIDDYLLTKGE